MKTNTSSKTLKKRRMAKLDGLSQCGPFVMGSLNRVQRKDTHGKVTAYYLLTFKEEGKTRSIYVPKDMVKELRSWIRNYRTLKKKMTDVSTISISIIWKFVSEKRDDAEKSLRRPENQ